jgi:hypothetical protein
MNKQPPQIGSTPYPIVNGASPFTPDSRCASINNVLEMQPGAGRPFNPRPGNPPPAALQSPVATALQPANTATDSQTTTEPAHRKPLPPQLSIHSHHPIQPPAKLTSSASASTAPKTPWPVPGIGPCRKTISHPINRSPKPLRRAGKIQNLIILIKQRTYQRLPPAKPGHALVLVLIQVSSAAKPRSLHSPKVPFHAYHAYHAPFPSATLGRKDNHGSSLNLFPGGQNYI